MTLSLGIAIGLAGCGERPRPAHLVPVLERSGERLEQVTVTATRVMTVDSASCRLQVRSLATLAVESELDGSWCGRGRIVVSPDGEWVTTTTDLMASPLADACDHSQPAMTMQDMVIARAQGQDLTSRCVETASFRLLDPEQSLMDSTPQAPTLDLAWGTAGVLIRDAVQVRMLGGTFAHPARDAALAPDGRRFVTIENLGYTLIDVATGRREPVFAGHRSGRVFLGAEAPPILLTPTQVIRQRLPAIAIEDSSRSVAAISLDGRRLAIAGDRIRIYDLVGGRVIAEAELAAAISAMTFSPDGSRVYAVSPRGLQAWALPAT